MNNIVFIIFIILLFGAVLLFGWWMWTQQFSEADKMLEKWATENNYQIVDKQNANVGDGPMGRRGSGTYVKYKITVKDSSGAVKTGIITLGSKGTGVLSDEVNIDWDKPIEK